MSTMQVHSSAELAQALSCAIAPGLQRRMATCDCGEILTPRGQCLNVGDCRTADRHATRGSLRKGTAASSPAAWTIGGGVD